MAAPAPSTAPAGALHAARRLLAPVLWMLLLLAIVVAAVSAGVAWLARSQAGTQWLLARVPGMQASGVQGALWSSGFAIERLHLQVGGTQHTLTLEGLRAEGLVWFWRPHAKAWIGVDVARLSARRVQWQSGPSTPRSAPRSLDLALSAKLAAVSVDELLVDKLAPIRQLRARGVLGANDGSVHEIEQLSFTWDRLQAQASGRIETKAPFTLKLDGQLQASAGEAWQAGLQAQGPLEHFQLQAGLRGSARAGHEPQRLELQAGVRSFAPWPLASLKASTQALDLAALFSAAPQTRLSGFADIVTQSASAPISAEIKLDNAAAGRWDQQRLPLRRIELALRTSAQTRDHVEITRFELSAGDATQTAGQWRGSGHWRAGMLELDTQLAALRPQLLDVRAPKLLVSGPLRAVMRGLPRPDAWQGGAPAAAQAASSPMPTPQPKLTLEVTGTLDGQVDAAPLPVRVQLDALWSAQRLELRELRASAGNALAQGRAVAEATSSGAWTVKSEGSLSNFDPVLWWPGTEGSAWRQGPHRVSGNWQLDLRLPTSAQRLAWLPLLQTTAGSGVVRVRDSQIAGVPVQLELVLGHQPGDASGTPSSLRGELRAAGNRLSVEGRADPLGAGTADRWQAELKADKLAALAAIVRLVPDLAEWAPREGSATASVQGVGRWPDMRSEGQAQLDGVRLGELQLQRAQTSWRFNTASDQPLNITADVQGLRMGTGTSVQQLHTLRAELQGTLRQHVLQAQATLPQKPPQWMETLFGLNTRGGTRAALRAEGSWVGDGSGGGAWRGRVAQLALGPGEASGAAAGAASTAAPSANATVTGWLLARDLRAEMLFSAQGGLVELRADAGRARLADAMTLRWDAVELNNRGARPAFTLRAEIEPFLAAPMLARLQPTMGWGGELQLGARLDIKAAEAFDADVVFERRSGDLYTNDGTGRQTLGLNTLRMALAAHGGRWSVTQDFAGRTLGDIKGALNLRLPATQRWPDAQSAIEGSIEGRVGNIGIWSAWVPPGWRLQGSLTTNASVSGTLGTPDYRGQVQGQAIGARNLLQGVDVSGGEVMITLNGTRAQIDRFVLRGGDGELAVSGSAELEPRPLARLQLQAQRFRVLGRVDRQLTASGKATLELRPDLTKLDGELKVDEGLYDVSRRDAPALDDDVVLRTSTGELPVREVIDAARQPRRNMQMDVQIDLGEKLRVRGRGLDTQLAGQLRLTTPQNRLAVRGIVRAVGGTYAAYAQKLEIERGILNFSGAPDNPGLDILALRPNIDAKVGVAIAGNLIKPRIRLYADPEMGDTDKLSWLVLGRPSDGLGRADTALLQRAAVALLAGEGEAPTDGFLRAIGIDELSLKQSDGEVRETVITLGKQLSRRWYLGYERGVNATTGTWQLIYRIAQRFTLRAQSGADNSLDVIWVWRVGETPMLPGVLGNLVPMRKSAAPAAPSAPAPAPSNPP